MKLKLQNFWIVLLILSILWLCGTFGPFAYSLVSPAEDLSAIVRAMQGRGEPPSAANDLVREVHDEGGLLKRAVHIGHYKVVSAELRNGVSHTSSRVSDTYIVWFQKLPKPILVTIERSSDDGVPKEYAFGSSDSFGPLVRAYLLPVLALLVSIYLVRKRKHPQLSEPPGRTTGTGEIVP